MAENERICVGCGCTDENACIDPVTGEPCYWVDTGGTGLRGDLCSVCAYRAIEETSLGLEQTDEEFVSLMHGALERGFTKRDSNAPLVEIYSDHEADLVIRERRKGL
jgi:hypothetical protein